MSVWEERRKIREAQQRAAQQNMNQQFDAPVRAQPLVVQAVQPAQALNALGISASDRANIDRSAIS